MTGTEIGILFSMTNTLNIVSLTNSDKVEVGSNAGRSGRTIDLGTDSSTRATDFALDFIGHITGG